MGSGKNRKAAHPNFGLGLRLEAQAGAGVGKPWRPGRVVQETSVERGATSGHAAAVI